MIPPDDKWSDKSGKEVFQHACGVIEETALYNRDDPNGDIASRNR